MDNAGQRRVPPNSLRRPRSAFNNGMDAVPPLRLTAEPEIMSDAASSVHRRRVRADEPIHFSVRPRPTPRSSGEYISSASSYAASSQTSSSINLSSTTDGSSVSSGLFEYRKRPSETSSTSNVLTSQLKKLYHEITHLEVKIKQAKTDGSSVEDETTWEQRIQDHKKFAAAVQNLLEISLAPSVPASLRNVPNKYNLVERLWKHGYSLLLESLRRAAFLTPPGARDGLNIALEHLTDFIFYAYAFYAALLEEPQMATFRNGWLEALGDLAWYKSMVESFLERSEKVTSSASGTSHLTAENLSGSMEEMASVTSSEVPGGPNASHEATRHSQPRSHLSAAQSIQKGSIMTLSIGPHAAALLALEPEPERWRNVAREWYGIGLNDQPGTGKLHHHIGLLCRDSIGTMTNNNAESEMVRGVYHFFKSMIALHPFPHSRESVLPLFLPLLEDRNSSSPKGLFLTLHGMMYTGTDMEAFDQTFARFIESLRNSISPLIEREWVMMAVINLAAVLEHGKATGILRMAMGGATSRSQDGGDRMDVDDDPSKKPLSPSLDPALNLTFFLLSYAFENPFLEGSVNPYISVVMTFLATILKCVVETTVFDVIQRFVPWHRLAQFLQNDVPRDVWESQELVPSSTFTFKPRAVDERWPMLTSSTAPALPEDWCLRGTEWVGRRIYERGFWQDNGGDDEKFSRVEIRYLYDSPEESECNGNSGRHYQGIIINDARFTPRPTRHRISMVEVNKKRFVRILRCGITIASLVSSFSWSEGTTEFTVNDDHEMQVDG